jgi:autotransporter translocation and assembly factor TamB
MRHRSLAAPLILVTLGGLFLWRNAHPEAPVFDLIATYWPFLLIAWGLVRLIEVLLWRSSRHPSLTGGEIVLLVLVCMAGAGLFEVHRHGIRFTPAIFGEQFEYPVAVQGPAAGAKRIVFDNLRGTIRISGADIQEIRVTGHKLVRAYTRGDADRTNGETAVELVPQGDRLVVASHQERAPADQRISDDLEVTVPRGVAIEAAGDNTDYEITEINGDVELRGARGDARLSRIGGNVRLEIGRSGTIAADGVQGNIDLQGRGSDVQIENVMGQVTVSGAYVGSLDFKNLAKPLRLEGERMEVRAAAVPGSLNMDLGDLTARNLVGPVRLVTQSRDVHLEGFTESLELESRRGDIELQPVHVPLPRIEAHSGSGQIELVLPEKAAFQLRATAERGEAVNDFGPPIETQTEGRTQTLKGTVGEGPVIRITAARGSVSVRKEGTAPSGRMPEPPRPPAPPKPPKAPAPPPPPPAPVNLKDSEVKL